MAQIRAQNFAGVDYPLLRVLITVAGQPSLGHLAIVDSGATNTIFPAETLEANGIRYKDLPIFGDSESASGSFETRLCLGVVKWRRTSFCDRFLVAEPRTTLGDWGWGLLGRDDFFNVFDVDFRWDIDDPVFSVDKRKSS